MRILFLGDIVGRSGRRALRHRLRALRSEESIDFVVGNGENASGGKGLDVDSADELLDSGIDVITSGNHIWQHRQIVQLMERDSRLVRPQNFPCGNPGVGWTVRPARDGTPVGVLNLIGRVFMANFDCPFRAADEVLSAIKEQAKVVLVDMHAEATSEKVAMGWHLAGRVTAVIGSHTHVQTADERVLPGETAYLSDAGMCGPIDSVIGMRKEQVLERFRTQMPVRFEVAPGPVTVQGAIIEVDPATGRGLSIRRFQELQAPC